jgi:aspartyl-tRNA(Asn)/glutamyl-tRNA(Gln) amidotransferase subunit A
MAPLPPAAQRALVELVRRRCARPVVRRALRRLTRSPLPTPDVERIGAARPAAHLVGREGAPWATGHGSTSSAGLASGPLTGETVVIKDSVDVAGLPTGMGLHGDPGAPAERDAVIVDRLRRAGARIGPKTVMTELGTGGLGATVPSGTPQNPSSPGYCPGGSSTGTAVAVSSGAARYGVGGDGLGSVRIPAAFNGLVGLKPTHGRLPDEGYPSPAPTLDVPGPLARTVTDCALLWQVLDDQPVRALTPLVPERVGIVDQLGLRLACSDLRATFARALERLGSPPLERCSIPEAELATQLAAASAFYELSRSPYADAPTLTTGGQLLVALGRSLTERDYAQLSERRRAMRAAAVAALDECGVLLMPTTGVPAPALSDELLAGGQDVQVLRAIAAYTPFCNATGLPAITVPIERDTAGRPLSVMVVGPPDSETELLRIALALEARPNVSRGR